MCGLAGFWCNSTPADARVAERMAERIASRGPDDAGIWLDEGVGLALAHRRLAILDLSAAGHQPMVSPCGRYVLVYNGEIYNHQDLREDLAQEGGQFNWRGHSDTETLLAALRHWGVSSTLSRLNGMFAFALWDAQERCLFLARDRMGEKPLYYGHSGTTFLFGSELKALRAHPNWHGEVDRAALSLYLRHNYVPAPWSIYKNIYKLPPAHFTVIRDAGQVIGEPQCYWDLKEVAEQGTVTQNAGAQALTDELDSLLRDAVALRMAADVPLGVFLSGGYDSTTIAALMQFQSTSPVKTFSIGFIEAAYDEAQYAKVVAKHLGTEHTELYVTPKEAMAVIPLLPTIYDEPFSDSSQIPTYLVSQMARKHVKVSLSGDGGDELFLGYNRYLKGYQLWKKLSILPVGLLRYVGWTLAHLPAQSLDRIQRFLPQKLQVSSLPDRLPKLAEVMTCRDGDAFYRHLVSHWKQPDQIVLNTSEPETLLSCPGDWPKLPGLREQMMYLDMLTYLPDDILTKVDRASMAVSLETRVPLLDHRVVEFAWRVPTKLKYRDGQGKWLLRQVLYRYVPPHLVDRPKMGFAVPIGHWLRGPLREWAEDLLSERRLREEEFFDPIPIRKMWAEHISGKQSWHYYLWDVLMFQAWWAETKRS